MQNIRKWTIIILLLLPIILLVGMRVAWCFVPKKPMVVLAMNKTELTSDGQERQPLFWILKHDRYVRKNGLLYDGCKDYLGLFPLNNKQYSVKDFQNMSENDIQHIASNIDVTYYIGTSGVSADVAKRSGFAQRGMTEKDMSFLKEMKKSRKLIFAEFNFIASSTNANVGRDFENEFGIRWSGWIGHYFATLDTVNSELPKWLFRGYKKQHNGKWPFNHSGIVFVNRDGTIEVLEEKKDLIHPVPLIHTLAYGVTRLGMQKRMPYLDWFDIVQIADSANHAISVYELLVNERGRQFLNTKGIPVIFPSVIMHKGKDYEFYYFCGNYCDNKIPLNSSYFIGTQHLTLMLDGTSKNLFFYKFFRPMLSSILQQYYNKHIQIYR
jgi:hypothetical protein